MYRITHARCRFYFRLRFETERVLEGAFRIGLDGRIRKRANPPARADHCHFYAQVGERLSQFESNDARADHRDLARQVRPFEHVVVDDDAVAKRPILRWDDRRRTSCDHHAACPDTRMVANLQQAVVDKAGIPGQLIGNWNRFDAVEYKAHQTVALALHPLHDFAAVDANGSVDVYAERRRVLRGMSRLCSGDQQFRWHAPDTCTSRTVRSPFNEDRGSARRLGGAIRRQAGTAGTNNGYIGLDCLHEFLETVMR